MLIQYLFDVVLMLAGFVELSMLIQYLFDVVLMLTGFVSIITVDSILI